jgi:hypothetical protein
MAAFTLTLHRYYYYHLAPDLVTWLAIYSRAEALS